MTYTESKQQNPFDWGAFLAKESYTEDELREASAVALQQSKDGDYNKLVFGLRVQFYVRIDGMKRMRQMNEVFAFNQYKKTALTTLHAIEARSAEVIREMKNNH